MGKKKTNQAQQQQRLQDVDDNFTDNSNRPTQRITEEKVNKVHDIFPEWPKADIRRALEDNDYDEERVVQIHLQGGDSWQEVSKTKVKETVNRPKSRRTVSGNQTAERGDRGTSSQRGRGGTGRGGKSITRTDRGKTDTDVTAASVKEFIAPLKETTDDNVQQARSFRSYSEAAAVNNEPVVVPVSEPVVPTKPEKRPKRERIVKKDTIVEKTQMTSPTSPPTRQLPSDVILPPQQSPKKSLSPQDRKQDTVVLPVGFNAVNVQFGSLGINDTENVEKDSHPSAPTLEQKQTESQTEFYGQTTWGTSTTEPYQTEPVNQYEEGTNASQYSTSTQQPYGQQQPLYGFQQQQSTQTQTQPRTGDKGSQAQRTSPNLPYAKQPYPPTHPYTGMSGAQYQYPTYSYPPPYMMPNQFQYHNYPMPGNKYGQFYGQNKPYNAYAPTTGNATAPTTDDNNLDYNKQFEMNQYFYMQQQQQQPLHPQQQQQTDSKVKKDSRSPNDQSVDAQQQQQHQQAFGHYPYAMHHYGHYMFQPQGMGFPQQYQPQQPTQQGAQSHGKSGSRDQQQQSSLTSTWQ